MDERKLTKSLLFGARVALKGNFAMENDAMDNFAKMLGVSSLPNIGEAFHKSANFGDDAFGMIAEEYTQSLGNPLSGYNPGKNTLGGGR